MGVNLDTGVVARSKARSKSWDTVLAATEFDDTTPAEVVVFPSDGRRLLIVEPNTMLVVTGYNLGVTGGVVFRKVLRSNGVPAQGSAACCPSITISHSIRLHAVEIPCWALNSRRPIFVIKTPGSYELDVVGEAADAVVTAMAFPMQEVNNDNFCEFGNYEPLPVAS